MLFEKWKTQKILQLSVFFYLFLKGKVFGSKIAMSLGTENIICSKKSKILGINLKTTIRALCCRKIQYSHSKSLNGHNYREIKDSVKNLLYKERKNGDNRTNFIHDVSKF